MEAIAAVFEKGWTASLAMFKKKSRIPNPPLSKDAATEVLSKNVTISTPTNLSARIYLPANFSGQKIPIVVYFHGGGFCRLDSTTTSANNHGYMNQLVSECNVIVFSVKNRLSPEHYLSAAFDDCSEALQWVASHFVGRKDSVSPDRREDWLINHGDFDRLFVGGDNTGATIAHYLSSNVGVKILGTILCFPFFCDEKTSREKLVYSKGRNSGVLNMYINPFTSGSGSHQIQIQRMFVCYAEDDDDDEEDIDPVMRFVKEDEQFGISLRQLREIEEREQRFIAMRFVARMKDETFSGEVTVVPVRSNEDSFHLLYPSGSTTKSLFQDIASFIHR